MKKITEVLIICLKCSWTGTVWEGEPDCDGDGNIGCPECNCVCCPLEDTVDEAQDKADTQKEYYDMLMEGING